MGAALAAGARLGALAPPPSARHPALRRAPSARRPLLAMLDPASTTAELAAAAGAAVDLPAVLGKAGRAALGGGASGAAASVVQVLSLMWVRTTINYQYRNGGSSAEALGALWKEGGIGRLYQGLPFALLQAPLTRFGDVAANTGVPILLDAFALSAGLPPFVRQVAPSVVGAAWRIVWMPVDTAKTTLQVEGEEALATLRGRVRRSGPSTLWEGSLAAAATSFAGSYPWWLTYNFLDSAFPPVDPSSEGAQLAGLVRLAAIGFCAVAVSDTASNSLRVIKTTKQTSAEPITYLEAVRAVLDKDGLEGLFLRGLGSKLVANGLQGALFSVTWKYFERVLLAGGGPAGPGGR